MVMIDDLRSSRFRKFWFRMSGKKGCVLTECTFGCKVLSLSLSSAGVNVATNE